MNFEFDKEQVRILIAALDVAIDSEEVSIECNTPSHPLHEHQDSILSRGRSKSRIKEWQWIKNYLQGKNNG